MPPTYDACVQERMDPAVGVKLQITDYSQECEFLKSCAESNSFNVAKMANDSIIVTSKDMLCLREGQSIGSEVIDCYLQILENQSNPGLDISLCSVRLGAHLTLRMVSLSEIII